KSCTGIRRTLKQPGGSPPIPVGSEKRAQSSQRGLLSAMFCSASMRLSPGNRHDQGGPRQKAAGDYTPPLLQAVWSGRRSDGALLLAGRRGVRAGRESARGTGATFRSPGQKNHLLVHGWGSVPTRSIRLQAKTESI